MVTWHLAVPPVAQPVRDEETGLVVDGYRITAVSDATGNRAVFELPRSRFSPETVNAEAQKHLGVLDATTALYGTKPATG